MQKHIVRILIPMLLVFLIPSHAAHAEAQAYCVCALYGGTVAEEQADAQLGVAGLSKLPAVLTLCRAFDRELIAEDAQISVGKSASAIGGPTAFLKSGEVIEAQELIRAAVMISAGDAIYALMEHAFGSEDVFLQNIALTLRSLGIERDMTDCLGANERFSCRELLKLGEAAAQSPTFLKYCTVKYAVLKHADGRDTELASANKLLTTLSGCFGLFTGSSKTDGYCGVFACKRGEAVFLCAIVGAENSAARFQTASKLFEETFANYRTYRLCEADVPLLESYPVANGDATEIDLYTRQDVSLLLKKSDGEPQPYYDLPDPLIAPLDPEHAVGSVQFCAGDGTVLYESALYPKEAVASMGFCDILRRILLAYTAG